jgi:3',5'-nucleoside bisphosphate phosphatase
VKSADLHLHSRFSDGTYLPDDLPDLGRRFGFSALALTDHDSVEGCAAAAEACRFAGIEFIAGTELTAELNGNEVHFLGYCIDTSNATLLAALAKFQTVRQNRIHEIVARINHLNIPLQADQVFALANCRSPGRPHVGRALVKAGFCVNQDEAFERFLKKHRPAWVPKFKISAIDAIGLIHQAGGLAVLAHPGLNRNDDAIPALAHAGLDGLECYHSKHSQSATERYLSLARQFNLLVTGGSDCHGNSKGKPVVGSVRLPYECVESLRRNAGCPHPPGTLRPATPLAMCSDARPPASPAPQRR